jgi:hypothetical protein
MTTPDKAGELAEEAIRTYVAKCAPASLDDLANCLELLMSKTALGIAKNCGINAGASIMLRTWDNTFKKMGDRCNIAPPPATDIKP